jgi:undecaprenyl-diphosphatase
VLGAWDTSIFRWINTGWSSPFADDFFRFFSAGLQLPWVIVLMAVALLAHLLAGGNLRRAGALAMICWPIANALTDAFKHFFNGARPMVELAGVKLIEEYDGTLLVIDSSGSVSAHAANMAAVASVIALEAKWWGAPWILFAFFTGLSRIYTGAHYPSQVLFGWVLGFFCAFVISRTWRAYRANRGKLKSALASQPPIQSRTD